MMLIALILIPLAGGLTAWAIDNGSSRSRWISLASLAIDAVLLAAPVSGPAVRTSPAANVWIADTALPWIPQLGISIHLAMDGLSLVLVALTLFIGAIAVLCSWSEIRTRVGFFHMNLLLALSGIIGVFLALDLFLFFFFWELMLVPLYFLIILWGHENRAYAALKFFLFTQAGSLLMLLSILALYFLQGRSTGVFSFDYAHLAMNSLDPRTAQVIMLGFLAAFLVKLPAFPLHPWLPDAHTEAPTAGSVVLAGLLLKTGAYGIIRFVLPLFPAAAAGISGIMTIIAAAGVLYGAVLALGQTDLKRLIAYTSVSHMGFVLLGLFAGTGTALAGAVMQMVAHGLSTGALFITVGMIHERLHTRDLGRMGGFWASAPRLSAAGLVFALASLGLPGTGNFVAEFLVLIGSFRQHPVITACAAAGLVLAAVYSLFIVQQVFHGAPVRQEPLQDLGMRESGMVAVLVIAILLIGLYPGPILDTTDAPLRAVQEHRAHVLPSAQGGYP